MKTFYHENGKLAWNGVTAFHQNGNMAWNGSKAYHQNNVLAYNGNQAFHFNTRTAWNGVSSYDAAGKFTGTEGVEIPLSQGIKIFAGRTGFKLFLNDVVIVDRAAAAPRIGKAIETMAA